MRKIFTTLKSVVAATVISAMALATSCSYDDTAIKNDVEKIKGDLATLTQRVDALEDKLDEQVKGLQDLINGKVVVTGVETVNGTTTVTLSDGSSFEIPAAGAATAAADTPYFSSIPLTKSANSITVKLSISSNNFSIFSILKSSSKISLKFKLSTRFFFLHSNLVNCNS